MQHLDSDIDPLLDGEIEALLDKLTERYVNDIATRLSQESLEYDAPVPGDAQSAAIVHFKTGRWAPPTVR